MRLFERRSSGGAVNHRYNLTDGVMLKDNHIAAAGNTKAWPVLAQEHRSSAR
ncbi:MAG: hypothetical protein ACLT98_17470 [Eggerthellaceae bacterium]